MFLPSAIPGADNYQEVAKLKKSSAHSHLPGGWKNLNFHGTDATSKRLSPFSWEVFHCSSAHNCCDLTILHEFAFWINLWHLEFGVLGKRSAAGEWISSTLAVEKIGWCLWEARRGIFWEAIWADIVGRVILPDRSAVTAEDVLEHKIEKEKIVVRPAPRWNPTACDSCWQHKIIVLKLCTDLQH